MRLIATLPNERDASILSQAFSREGIAFQIDPERITDWGTDEYGNVNYRLWIIDEDQVDRAMDLLQKFEENPQNPLFQGQEKSLRKLQFPSKEKIKEVPAKIIEMGRAVKPDGSAIGILTFYILIACCAIFMLEVFMQPNNWPVPSSLPLTPFYASPVKYNLLYDYPLPYELFNKFVTKFTPEKVLNPQELPQEAANTLAHIIDIPYWQGFYEKILDWAKGEEVNFSPDVPLFGKILKGEVWRLFTPALLHADIFHILFNMLWLYALGRQIEQKLRSFRYLFFILITGIITNTAQYLMSGSNFLGFSGILCAMISFIAVRQKLAAWEGYRLDHMTKLFILVFIFGMFFFQLTSFFIEVGTGVAISPGLANTAHITGLISGYILGQLPFFARR